MQEHERGRARLLALATVVAIGALGACDGAGGLFGDDGGRDGGGGDDGDVVVDIADTGGGGTDTGATDLGASPDLPAVVPDASSTRDTGGGEPVSGGVVVWQAESDMVDLAGVTAGFRRGGEQEPAGQRFGACLAVPVDPSRPAAPAASLDAGTILVTGTSAEVTMTFTDPLPAGGRGYASSLPQETESLHPAAGASITARAAGGADLPAFTLVTPTPAPVRMTRPSGGFFDSISADRALEVAWNAAEADTVVVGVGIIDVEVLAGSYEAVAGDSLLCTLEGPDPGTYTIPAEAMARLPGRGQGYYARVSVTRVRTTRSPLPDGEVSLAVTASTGVAPGLD